MHGRAHGERGQTAAEYLGALVLVAALVAVLATTQLGARVRGSIETVVCQIAGGACSVPADTRAADDTPPVERAARDLGALLEDGATPDRVAAFFAGLSPEDAAALAQEHPDLVGNTDGAPLTLRMDANALRIHAERERLEALGEDGPRLERLRALDDPNRRFLLFDPAGDGRAAEVFGDITTARHVAVVVPGVSNDLDNFTGADARRLQQAAAGLSTDGVATVQWLGYDTPDSVPGGLADGPGEAGAGALAPFQAGIDAQRGDGIHTTVIGHSYGSYVLGRSLRDSGLRADDTVVVGSPGMGVDQASDLGDGRGRLWAGLAAWDPIGLAPVKGAQPAGGDFGATSFAAGDGGHSSYFQDGSVPLVNLALITAGRPEDVSR